MGLGRLMRRWGGGGRYRGLARRGREADTEIWMRVEMIIPRHRNLM
jgi:hypothetical protein